MLLFSNIVYGVSTSHIMNQTNFINHNPFLLPTHKQKHKQPALQQVLEARYHFAIAVRNDIRLSGPIIGGTGSKKHVSCGTRNYGWASSRSPHRHTRDM